MHPWIFLGSWARRNSVTECCAIASAGSSIAIARTADLAAAMVRYLRRWGELFKAKREAVEAPLSKGLRVCAIALTPALARDVDR